MGTGQGAGVAAADEHFQRSWKIGGAKGEPAGLLLCPAPEGSFAAGDQGPVVADPQTGDVVGVVGGACAGGQWGQRVPAFGFAELEETGIGGGEQGWAVGGQIEHGASLQGCRGPGAGRVGGLPESICCEGGIPERFSVPGERSGAGGCAGGWQPAVALAPEQPGVGGGDLANAVVGNVEKEQIGAAGFLGSQCQLTCLVEAAVPELAAAVGRQPDPCAICGRAQADRLAPAWWGGGEGAPAAACRWGEGGSEARMAELEIFEAPPAPGAGWVAAAADDAQVVEAALQHSCGQGHPLGDPGAGRVWAAARVEGADRMVVDPDGVGRLVDLQRLQHQGLGEQRLGGVDKKLSLPLWAEMFSPAVEMDPVRVQLAPIAEPDNDVGGGDGDRMGGLWAGGGPSVTGDQCFVCQAGAIWALPEGVAVEVGCAIQLPQCHPLQPGVGGSLFQGSECVGALTCGGDDLPAVGRVGGGGAPAHFGDPDRFGGVAVCDHVCALQFQPSEVELVGGWRILGGAAEPIGVGGQHVEEGGSASCVECLQEIQVVDGVGAVVEGECQPGGGNGQGRGDRLDSRVGCGEHGGVAGWVGGAAVPFERQIGFVPDDHPSKFVGVPLGDVADKGGVGVERPGGW